MVSKAESQSVYDRWSFVHAATGALLTVAFWAAGIKWFSVLVVFALEIVWEIVENNELGFKIWKFFGYDYSGDSFQHTTVDIIVTTAGSALSALFLEVTGMQTGGIITGILAACMYGAFFIYVSKERKSVQIEKLGKENDLNDRIMYNLDGLVF